MTYINQVCTSVPITQINVLNELPFTFNNIFKCESPIYFAINFSYLNKLRVSVGLSSILSNDINSGLKSLVVFLCDAISGNNFSNVISTKVYNLSALNLVNNFLSQNISQSSGTFNMTHDDFCETLKQDDILRLGKTYKIIFRLTDAGAVNVVKSIQNGDIIHDFTLLLDTAQSGPYDVQFENVDVLSPYEFTKPELDEIYTNNSSLVGHECQRFFYPKNIENLNALPLALIFHGQNHNHLMYDIYGSKLASYGYFVVQVQMEINPNRPLYILRHLKKYGANIKNGYYTSKINFNKTALIGHSVGGYALNESIVALSQQDSSPTNFVPNMSVADVICAIFLEGASVTIIPSSYGLKSLYISSSNNESYTNVRFLKNEELASTSHFGVLLRDGTHEDLAAPFSPINAGSLGAPIGNKNIFPNNTRYRLNSRTAGLGLLAERMLFCLGSYFNEDIINYYYNDKNDYKSQVLKEVDDTSALFYKIPSNRLTLFESFHSMSAFTHNISQYNWTNDVSGYFSISQLVPAPKFGKPTLGALYTNGAFGFPYDGSELYINFNISSNLLNLEKNSWLSIVAGVSYSSTVSTNGVDLALNLSLYQHFGVQITDIFNNSAIISSRQNNLGIPVPLGNIYTSSGAGTYDGGLGANRDNEHLVCKYINFKASDFCQINPNLNLSQIKNVKLIFNSACATDSTVNGIIVLNGIYIIN